MHLGIWLVDMVHHESCIPAFIRILWLFAAISAVTKLYQSIIYLLEGIELLKCLPDIFCRACVSQIRSVLSIIFHALYGVVCFQLNHFAYDDCENTCTWSYYHHQIESMAHLPLLWLGHGKMVWAVCFYIFLCSLLFSLVYHFHDIAFI